MKIKDSFPSVHNVGVPQGSVLGSVLYTPFTTNISTTSNSTYTFAARILAAHKNPAEAVQILQKHIRKTRKMAFGKENKSQL